MKNTQATPNQKPQVDWVSLIFLVTTPIACLFLVPHYLQNRGFEPAVWVLFVVMYLATGFSITAGYHRLFSHRTYDAHPLVRLFFLVFGAGAVENSALKWCTDHRMHHRYVDQEKDPYNAKRGFYWSHIGWIFYKSTNFKPEIWGRDFLKDPMVMWQYKWYLPLCILVGFGLPTALGALFGSAWGGFVIAGLLRVVFVQHMTFFINSLAHIWGKSTYSEEHTAKDNFILAFFTYGEGYHNFHHQFANDYRNGIRWYHFDPTKWLIQALEKMGLAWNLRMTPKHEILLAKMQQRERRLFQNPSPWHDWVQESLKSFRDSVEQAGEKLQEIKARRDQIRREGKEAFRRWKEELRQANYNMKRNYQMWKAVLKAQRPLTFS
jgi:stearoyl-CoA desaturase (delta-9 desaturase)